MAMNALDGRILVTGGAGFIGSALVWALNGRGIDDIVVCDVLRSDEKWRNLVPLQVRGLRRGPGPALAAGAEPGRLREVLGRLPPGGLLLDDGAQRLVPDRQQHRVHPRARGMGARPRARASSTPPPPPPTATAARAWTTGTRRSSGCARSTCTGTRSTFSTSYARRLGWLERIVGLKYFNVFGPNEEHKGDMRSVVSKAHLQIRETGRIGLFKSYDPRYKDGGRCATSST